MYMPEAAPGAVGRLRTEERSTRSDQELRTGPADARSNDLQAGATTVRLITVNAYA